MSNNSEYKYANKTCNNCGIRKPANKMFKTIKTIKSGTSNTGLTARSILGAMAGDKRSGRQFAKWALSPSKRTYTRNREVWVCSNKCASALGGGSLVGGTSNATVQDSNRDTIISVLVLFGWMPIVFIIVGFKRLFEYNYYIGWSVVILTIGVILFLLTKFYNGSFKKIIKSNYNYKILFTPIISFFLSTHILAFFCQSFCSTSGISSLSCHFFSFQFPRFKKPGNWICTFFPFFLLNLCIRH